jgi:class 3 adenylate cyclase/tetratricopeptide (TPR) repeat protein
MLACPTCEAENGDQVRFCQNCGAPLAVDDEDPAEARKTVTILFSEVVDFSDLGRHLDPEKLRGVLDDYSAHVRPVLERHGASVDRYTGEAVRAVFGVPQVHDDDAYRAVRAATELWRTLDAFNEHSQRKWGVRLATRTGIGTGTVVSGGSDDHAQVVGDAVNQAARLGRMAHPGHVLISDATYRLVRDMVTVEPVVPLTDGGHPPVRTLRLLDVAPHPTSRTRHLQSPMVGRERELTLLLESFERAIDNQTCQLFTVIGDAGVGKSRLARELAGQVRHRTTVLRGRCLPYGEGITFWPLAAVVRQGTRLHEDDTSTEARSKLLAVLAGQEHGAAIADQVLQVLGMAEPTAPPEQVFWAVRKVLEALAGDRPLLVILDDIQWAEPTFLDLVEHITDRSREVPMLIACLARPELLNLRPTWAGGKLNASSILLEPLTDDACEQLLANLLDHQQAATDAWAHFKDVAEGNPLHVEEILAMLVDDGLLRNSEGRWVLATDALTTIVPPTIQALLAARLDRLPPTNRVVVGRASVIGRVFYRGPVGELVPVAVRPAVDDNLAALLNKGFIRRVQSDFAGEESFRFRHLLIRDAAYESLPKARRAELHQRFAVWLERNLGERTMELEEIIGYHFEQAFKYRLELGQVDDAARRLAGQAAERLSRAGRRAFGRGDLTGAINLLNRAGALLPETDPARLAIQGQLGQALRVAGDFSGADHLLAEVLAGAVGDEFRGLRARALVERTFVELYTRPEGRTEEALAQADAAIEVFERLGDDRGLVEAWNLKAAIRLMRLEMTERKAALEHALTHARRSGDERAEAWAIWGIIGSMAQGPTPSAEVILFAERELELARAKSYRVLEAGALLHLGRMLAMLGRFEEARQQVAMSRRICEELGMRFWAAVTWQVSGLIELLADDPAAAEQQLRSGYRELEQFGERTYLATVASYLAHALYELGNDDEAEHLTRMTETSAGAEDVHSQALWRGARAKIVARQHGSAEAVELAREGVRLAGRTDNLNARADALLDLAETMRLAGEDMERPAILREAMQLYEKKGNVVGARRAQGLLATV